MSRVDLDALPKYEKPACANCRALAPECMVPLDEHGPPLPCCWLCAHLLTVHEHLLGCDVSDCGCTVDQIYPASYMRRRRERDSVSGEVGGKLSAISGSIVERNTVAMSDRTQPDGRATSYLHVAARHDRRDRGRAAIEGSPIAVSIRRVAK